MQTEPQPDLLGGPAPVRRRHFSLTLVALTGLVAVGGLAWMLAGRGPASPVAAATGLPPGSRLPVIDGKLIRFTEDFARRHRITAVPVVRRPVARMVSALGTVGYDSRRFAAVGARVSGRVGRVVRVAGDTVKADEVLAEVQSPELVRVQAQIASARAREAAALTQARRESQLAGARISAVRDAELATAEHQAVRAERMAAEQTLRALGGRPGGRGLLQLRSPLAGKVIAAKVRRGQTVQPSDTLYEVADLSVVWVQLKVFERDLPAVRAGDVVEIGAATEPRATLELDSPARPAATARVDHVGDVIDPDTRTASVRVVVENPEGALRPGQSVEARILTGADAVGRVAVPRRTITRVDGKPIAFVMRDARTVEMRTVQIRGEGRDELIVGDGLRPGEQVVLGGLFALKSELFR